MREDILPTYQLVELLRRFVVRTDDVKLVLLDPLKEILHRLFGGPSSFRLSRVCLGHRHACVGPSGDEEMGSTFRVGLSKFMSKGFGHDFDGGFGSIVCCVTRRTGNALFRALWKIMLIDDEAARREMDRSGQV